MLWLVVVVSQLFALVLGQCDTKFQSVPGHSACLPPSPLLLKSGLAPGDILEILNVHNELRAKVEPAATNMVKLTWNSELAKVAQGWADNCEYYHEPGKYRTVPGLIPNTGQNLGYGYGSWSKVIQAWYDEVVDFTYNGVNDFLVVGHFTQVVWADTTVIGCGYSECSNFLNRYYVCNYGPSGNLQGKISIPYEAGDRCAKCPGKCVNGLCDCKPCFNGGVLDVATCTCKCPATYYEGAQCENLNCDTAVDGKPCGGYFLPSYCTRYINVPVACPRMCGVCPAK